jgi:hypothetical protein
MPISVLVLTFLVGTMLFMPMPVMIGIEASAHTMLLMRMPMTIRIPAHPLLTPRQDVEFA